MAVVVSAQFILFTKFSMQGGLLGMLTIAVQVVGMEGIVLRMVGSNVDQIN